MPQSIIPKSITFKIIYCVCDAFPSLVRIISFITLRRNLGISAAAATSEAPKVAFICTLKQTRLNDTESKKFTEYEIACQLRVPASIQRDKVVRWSVWKRFSDFEALDAALRRTLGWQMDIHEFPSSHSLSLNKFSSSFVEQRRYWFIIKLHLLIIPAIIIIIIILVSY